MKMLFAIFVMALIVAMGFYVMTHPLVVFIPIGLVLAVKFLPKLFKKRATIMESRNITRTNLGIASEVANSKLVSLQDVNDLRLNFGEVAYLVQDAVGYSPKTTTNHNAFFKGTSVPLPAHLAANLGKFQISSVETTSFESYGKGRLILTNERIVFIHQHGNVVIKLNNKILNVSAFSDGCRIDIEGKKPWFFQTFDIRFYATYLKCQEELSRLEIMELANLGRANFRNG